MSTQAIIKTKLETVFDERQATVLAEVIEDSYNTLVKTSDFNELKSIVKDIESILSEIAQEQKITRKELNELAQEQKITRKELNELAQEHKITRKIMNELAQEQKTTRKEMNELAVALKELASAQKKTEEELSDLTKEHKKTRQEVGGLSMTVGYVLEDRAYNALPELLKRDFNIIVHGKLNRRYIIDNQGRDIEVNIFGEALRDNKEIRVIGEAKSQLSKNSVNEFIRKKVKKLEGMGLELFPLLVCYMISAPDVEEYAKNKGIALYYSYDFSSAYSNSLM